MIAPTNAPAAPVTTGPDGEYTVNGLAAGTDHQACFKPDSWATGGSSDDTGYLEQCYLNQPSSGTPTPVTVTSGATTPLIDAQLDEGGAISGTVTDAGGTGQPLANVVVWVNSQSTGTSWRYAWTEADGSYTVKDLAAGTDYQVCFNDSTYGDATGGSSDEAGYVDQCHAYQPSPGTPTPVPVALGLTTPGIHAALVGAGP